MTSQQWSYFTVESYFTAINFTVLVPGIVDKDLMEKQDNSV